MPTDVLTIEDCRQNLARARTIIACFEALHSEGGIDDLNYVEVGCCFKEDEGMSTYVAAKFINDYFKAGHVHSIEMDAGHIEDSRALVEKYSPELLKRIDWYQGNSLRRLPDVLSKVDEIHFAFIDGGGHPATNFYEFWRVWERLADNGVILVDDCSFLKPSPAYPGRRDFGKAQLILPFLLLMEHINCMSNFQYKNNEGSLDSLTLMTILQGLPSTTPFTSEQFNNARVMDIANQFRDCDFAFVGNQLLVGRTATLSKIRQGQIQSRIKI